tara:strand:+ start:2936 stop:3907 length:972 start_codon:yes stop_codon:yes gene_type:complete
MELDTSQKQGKKDIKEKTEENVAPMKYGLHVSSTDSLVDVLERAWKNGQTIVQIFLGSNISHNRRKLNEIDKKNIRDKLHERKMKIVSHYPYVLNMATDNCNLKGLQDELNTMSSIGGRVVVHTGSATFGTVENRKLNDRNKKTWEDQWKKGCNNLIKHLKKLDLSCAEKYNVKHPLLLEPPAGEGKKLLHTYEQIKYVFTQCPKEIGFCLDTCHFFAAGLSKFDTIESIKELFDSVSLSIGDIEKLELIHFNDSKNPFKALKDDHEDIGTGYIWGKSDTFDGLMAFWSFCFENKIDIIAEVGSDHNMKVMNKLQKLTLKRCK